MEKKKMRRKPGQVFRVPLKDGTFGYGQTTSYNCAFFDLLDKGEEEDLAKITQKPILFRVGIANYAITDGIWPVIGTFPVAEFLEKDEDLFTFDIRNKQYLIWKTGTLRVPASPEEIHNLECFASWNPEHIEQRLRDHYAGRPNFDVEYFRNQHNPNFERDIEKFYAKYGYEFKLPDSFKD